jgi:hypothetical protein
MAADIACSFLRSEGIPSGSRALSSAEGPDFGNAHEIVVEPECAERARELLNETGG